MALFKTKLKSIIQNIGLSASSQQTFPNYGRALAIEDDALTSCDLPEGPGIEQLQFVLDKLLPIHPITGPWVAGGTARRLLEGTSIEEGDIDLFFHSFKSWSDFESDLIKKGYEKTYRTGNATTFDIHGYKVQLIRRQYYGALKNVLEDFDFTACQVAIVGDSIVGCGTAIEDINNKLLRYNAKRYVLPNTAVPRGLKYINYGFKPVGDFFNTMIRHGTSLVHGYDVFNGDEEFASSFYDSDEAENEDKMEKKNQRENAYKITLAEIIEKCKAKKND